MQHQQMVNRVYAWDLHNCRGKSERDSLNETYLTVVVLVERNNLFSFLLFFYGHLSKLPQTSKPHFSRQMNTSAINNVVLLLIVVHFNSLRQRTKLKRPALHSFILRSPLWFGEDNSVLHELVRHFFTRTAAFAGRGRPCLLDNSDQVGLFLLFLNSKMSYKHLCMIFGVCPSAVSEIIEKMLTLVNRRLRRHPAARICFPSQDAMMVQYAEITSSPEPLVNNIIDFVDGVSILVQCPEDEDIQNAYYNGYYHDTMINNVFAFAPTGKIIYASINCPGSWHDSNICSSLCKWSCTLR